MMAPDLPPCVFLSRSAPADRLRASLAHEIGHAVMHRVPTDTMEDEAYTFGAELLLPERDRLLGPPPPGQSQDRS